MRLSVLLPAIMFVSFGCERAEDPSEPAKAPEEAPVTQEEKQKDEILGKPLSYWVDQAGKPEDKEQTLKALMLALDDDRDWVRVDAADALGRVGPEAKVAAPKLTGFLTDVRPWVRVAAMETLAGLGSDAVPALIQTIKEGPPAAKKRAGLTLSGMGADAKAAIPVLDEVLKPIAPGLAETIKAQILGTSAKAGEGAPKTTAEGPVVAAPLPETLPPAKAAGWPQFRGPRRDALCLEKGLLKAWPKDGLQLLWKIEGLGAGYSSISIVGDKIFTMGDRGAEEESKAQYVLAYNASTQKEFWATPIGAPHLDGPRCTPTVDGGLVYAIGTGGDLACLDAESGKVRWRKHFGRDFGATVTPHWKFSESPLVDGDKLLCTPGGKDATIVALNKETGELIWKVAVPDLGERGRDGAAYSSIVVAEMHGVRQYVQLLSRGLVGVDVGSGKFLWGYNGVVNSIASVSTPVVQGNYVFVSTAYNTGSALVKIVRDGDGFKAEEVYFIGPKEFQNHHGGFVLVGNHIYGGSGSNKGTPVCLEFATGKVAWQAKAPSRGSAAVLYADGHLIFRYDRGEVFLIEATPEEFRIKGRFQAETVSGPAWAHPVVDRGKLFLRHNDLLLCYDISGK